MSEQTDLSQGLVDETVSVEASRTPQYEIRAGSFTLRVEAQFAGPANSSTRIADFVVNFDDRLPDFAAKLAR